MSFKGARARGARGILAALVVAHGTSLRALVMAIEQLTPDEIVTRELATGQPMIYRIDSDGRATLTV